MATLFKNHNFALLVAIPISNSKLRIHHYTMDLHEDGTLASSFKIRTITAFISESINYTNSERLSYQVKDVAEFLRQSQSIYESKGGSVYYQTPRTKLGPIFL